MAARPLAVKVLEQRGIEHELIAFDPAVRDAGEVAREAGVDPSQVLKTLVVEQDPPRGRPYLVLVPADRELDLKTLARELRLKRLRMASHRDAERHTGLKVGGISALALLGRGLPVLIDAGAAGLPWVLVSAGERGFDVRLATADLVALTAARPVPMGGPP